MIMLNTIFFIMFCFWMVYDVNSIYNNCCFQSPPITCSPQPQSNATVIQGRPGKIGPVGPPGPVGVMGMKGDKGARGECSCNQSEIEELKQTLQDTVARFNVALSNNYEFCYAGIKSGRIPNSAMSASSIYADHHKAYYGRLDSRSKSWHPASGLFSGSWLQVDFGEETRVYGVVTQGRPNRNFRNWITSYNILSGNSSTNLEMINSGQNEGVFQGNEDWDSHIVNYFPSPVTARYFRLVVVTYSASPELRMEYLLC